MRGVVALALLLLPASALAHDFWIEPANFKPAPGSLVQIRLRVGEQYLGDPVGRLPASELIRFDAITAKGTVPVRGRAGEDPAGTVQVEHDGLVLVAYQNTARSVEVPADKLASYLAEEGLEAIAASWLRRHSGKKPWRELYSRCAKALLWTGSGDTTLYAKPLGLPLELVPERNPYALGKNRTLPLQLLHRGKPLAGALVAAVPRSDPRAAVSARTDAQGRVRLELRSGGEWLIKAVHLFPAAAGAAAEWESHWASLTFSL